MRETGGQGEGSAANPPTSIRLRNEIPASVQRTGRRSVRELAELRSNLAANSKRLSSGATRKALRSLASLASPTLTAAPLLHQNAASQTPIGQAHREAGRAAPMHGGVGRCVAREHCSASRCV